MKKKRDHLLVSYCSLRRAYKIASNSEEKASFHPDKELSNSPLYRDLTSKKSKEYKKVLASCDT